MAFSCTDVSAEKTKWRFSEWFEPRGSSSSTTSLPASLTWRREDQRRWERGWSVQCDRPGEGSSKKKVLKRTVFAEDVLQPERMCKVFVNRCCPCQFSSALIESLTLSSNLTQIWWTVQIFERIAQIRFFIRCWQRKNNSFHSQTSTLISSHSCLVRFHVASKTCCAFYAPDTLVTGVPPQLITALSTHLSVNFPVDFDSVLGLLTFPKYQTWVFTTLETKTTLLHFSVRCSKVSKSNLYLKPLVSDHLL